MDPSTPKIGIVFNGLLPYIEFTDVVSQLETGFTRDTAITYRAVYSDGAGHVLTVQNRFQDDAFTGKVMATFSGTEGDLARLVFTLPEPLDFLQELPVGTLFPTGVTTLQLGTQDGDSMSGWTNADSMIGRAGNDRIAGLEGSDLLLGLSGRDVLLGGAGGDVLAGGRGNDRQIGGVGSDILIADAGKDVLRSGAGADTFVVLDTGGRAVLADFDPSQDTLMFVKGMTGGTLFVDDWADLGAAFRDGGTPLSDLFGDRSLADLSTEELASVGLSLSVDPSERSVIGFGSGSVSVSLKVEFTDILVSSLLQFEIQI